MDIKIWANVSRLTGKTEKNADYTGGKSLKIIFCAQSKGKSQYMHISIKI